MHASLYLLACYNILGAKPAGAGAGVGSGAHIPLAHHKPRAIARWAAGQFARSLAGWLAGWAGGLADGAPTTTAETRVLKRTVISIYGDRVAPCICEMLCSNFLVLRAPPAPTRQVPRKKGRAKKRKRKKKSARRSRNLGV